MESLSEGKYLGKQVDYPQQYAPEMLVAVPRHLNREDYHLSADNLPFVGYDAWHAYELSFLTARGLPVTGLLKIVYLATNPSLVESKSLKLYLNSFNMDHFGQTSTEGLAIVLDKIKADLSNLLETEVELGFYNTVTKSAPFDFEGYQLLEEASEVETISFDQFNEAPQLLEAKYSDTDTLQVATHLLRSNCKITHQPDWGSAYIHMKGETLPDTSNLLQYLVSIRNENHFHEEICEMIYKRLWDIFQPEELAVTCIYTRRGGIDICPARASHASLLPKSLIDAEVLSKKLLRQ